jgi:hypothetical protein
VANQLPHPPPKKGNQTYLGSGWLVTFKVTRAPASRWLPASSGRCLRDRVCVKAAGF